MFGLASPSILAQYELVSESSCVSHHRRGGQLHMSGMQQRVGQHRIVGIDSYRCCEPRLKSLSKKRAVDSHLLLDVKPKWLQVGQVVNAGSLSTHEIITGVEHRACTEPVHFGNVSALSWAELRPSQPTKTTTLRLVSGFIRDADKNSVSCITSVDNTQLNRVWCDRKRAPIEAKKGQVPPLLRRVIPRDEILATQRCPLGG